MIHTTHTYTQHIQHQNLLLEIVNQSGQIIFYITSSFTISSYELCIITVKNQLHVILLALA